MNRRAFIRVKVIDEAKEVREIIKEGQFLYYIRTVPFYY